MTRLSPWLPAVALVAATPAAAQTAPPAPVTLSGEATLVSDYRLRGLSQSDRDPAVQASLAVDTLIGLHAGAEASTIGGYVARGADAELDLSAGFRRSLGGTGVDAGIAYTVYPGHGTGATDFAEPYVNLSQSYGPLTATVGANVAWAQRGLGLAGDRRSGAYLHGELSAGIPRTPLTATARIGHAFVANALTFGRRYTDWSLGATYTLRALTFGARYVDSDLAAPLFPRAATRGPADAGGGTVVGSVALGF